MQNARKRLETSYDELFETLKFKKFDLDLPVLFSIGLLAISVVWSVDARWSSLYLVSSVLAFWFIKRDFWIPRIPAIYAIIGSLGLTGVILANNHPGYFYYHFIDWLCFFVIAVAGLNTEKLDFVYFTNRALTILVMAIGLFQFYKSPNNYPSSLFLYQNITAQFLAVSLILQVASKRFALVGPTLAYIFILHCRSIWVALAVVGVLFVLRNAKVNFGCIKDFFKNAAVGAVITIVLITSQNGLDPKTPMQDNISVSKGESTDIRLIRWANTFAMIKDNPMGIGPGNYEWNYSRYAFTDPEHKPRLNIRSPHNGYLELAVEWGIPAALLALIGLALLVRKIYFDPLAFSVVVLFIVDASFAFPMELAYPFYITAFLMGYGLRNANAWKLQASSMYLPNILVLLLILSFGLRDSVAEIWEKTATKTGFYNACKLKPRDWQVCLNHGANLLHEKKYAAANRVFDDILKERPNMHPAVLLNFQAYKGLKDKDGMARSYKRYLELMPEDRIPKKE